MQHVNFAGHIVTVEHDDHMPAKGDEVGMRHFDPLPVGQPQPERLETVAQAFPDVCHSHVATMRGKSWPFKLTVSEPL
ncbi:MAG TPA: hypothetical protein VGK40_02685, partial [Verrucomicrobiae bacterium]